ncbi:MAG: hypothetical protein O7C73_01970 [Nitrospirae bacterium]|nr:hypothetical protein [Nitrospirota bacterium]
MTFHPVVLVILAWIVAAAIMVVLWLVQRGRPNTAIADVGWCGGIALIALWYAAATPGDLERRL